MVSSVNTSLSGGFSRGEPLTSASIASEGIVPSGVAFLDAFLGGGFVRGEVAAFIGGPGTGKTTLLFSIAQMMSTRERVLFAAGEEPAKRLRGHTVPDEGGALKVFDDWGTDLAREPKLCAEIAEFKPTVVLVDTVDSFSGRVDRLHDGAIRYSALERIIEAIPPDTILIASCHIGYSSRGHHLHGRVKSVDRVFHTVRDPEGLLHGVQQVTEVDYDLRALRDGSFDQ